MSDSSLVLKTSLVVLSSALLALLISKIRKISAREPYLPPGPPTTLLLGNLDVFPKEWPWFKFTEWAAEYGDIYSLKMGPGTAIVITGVDAMKELLDKRNATTVDRPKSYMVDTVQSGLSLALGRYSNEWRAMRKTAQVILSSRAIENHLPIQKAEATQVLYDLLKSPEKFYTHFRRYSNSVIMSVIYGKRSPRYESHETQAFYEAMRLWTHALEPWAHPPIDMIPVLNYIPEKWASWKQFAQKVRRKQRDLYFTLLDECEKRMTKGEEYGCFMEEMLARQEEFQLTREMIGYLCGTLTEGGSETTAAFLQSLVILLAAFPDAQRKAQKEMDTVVGPDRLPSLDDVPDLPYIQALIKETHRLRPVTPVLLPHASLTTEEYRGYVIPKGATIFVNMYGIFHSPDYFDNPETFYPDRFLSNEYGTKPGVDVTNFRSNLIFGCGRRICPGEGLANNALMLNTLNLVWAFNFNARKDSGGRDLPLDIYDYVKGIIGGPTPFDCVIKPRNDRAIEIIEREFRDATEIFSKFEKDLRPEDKKWVEDSRRDSH